MKIKLKTAPILAAILSLLTASHVYAAAYPLPSTNESLIGQRTYRLTGSGETVSSVARHYDIGRNAVKSANPHLDINNPFPTGEVLQVPTQHLLPNEKRRGIVINLPEMRLYYYPKDTQEVFTYPIGIGKVGKTIPIERTKVTRKTKNPIWIPPDDIREFNLNQGIVLPKIMPSGPNNPLGPYAIYTGIPTYLIHSTLFPDSVGKRASFGCIRMYEWDIETIFPTIKHGIPIAIINMPTKMAWENDRLYLEAHQPLEEHQDADDATMRGIVGMLGDVSKNHPALIDWQLVSYITEHRDGIPHEVGMRLQAD